MAPRTRFSTVVFTAIQICEQLEGAVCDAVGELFRDLLPIPTAPIRIAGRTP